MNKVTGDELKAAMIEKGLTYVAFSDCSLCGYQTNFQRRGQDLYFDAGCHCIAGPLSPRSWEHAAQVINVQEDSPFGIKLKQGFGLAVKSEN